MGIVQLRRDYLKQHHTLCTAVCKEAVNPTQYLLWEHPFQPSLQQDSGLSDSAEAKFFRRSLSEFVLKKRLVNINWNC